MGYERTSSDFKILSPLCCMPSECGKKDEANVMIEIALIKYNRTPGRFLGIDTDFFFIFAGWTWAIDFIYDSQSRHFRSPYCDFFLSLDFLNVCHLCRLKCFHSRSWWYFLFNEKKTRQYFWFVVGLRFINFIPSSNCCYFSYDILCLTNDHSK